MSSSEPIQTPPRSNLWVVGFDGSDAANGALAWVAANAPGRTQRIEVVTAWESAISTLQPASAIAIADAHAAVRLAAEADADNGAATLEQLLAHGSAEPIDVSTVCVHGGASAALLDRAEAADVLVVGNRGRGGFSRLVLGSTSNQCATHALAPTIVVRETPGRDVSASAGKIVVGVDGSDNSLAAVRWAIDFARPGSHVAFVWVWDVSPLAVGADQFFFPEASDIARSSFESLVEAHCGAAADADVTVSHSFIEGTPRSALLEASSDADLIVVGARGHGAIGSALLGSVSSWLIHHADRSVAVVPNR